MGISGCADSGVIARLAPLDQSSPGFNRGSPTSPLTRNDHDCIDCQKLRVLSGIYELNEVLGSRLTENEIIPSPCCLFCLGPGIAVFVHCGIYTLSVCSSLCLKRKKCTLSRGYLSAPSRSSFSLSARRPYQPPRQPAYYHATPPTL